MSIKILIVEDEFVVANALRLTVEQAGYKVNGIAGSAEEAEVYLRTNKPDLVLLDIRLNGKKSGIDLARQLRADNIAFIYLSANSSQKILEEAKTTDPYGFLVKPFREKDLLVTLDVAWYRHNHNLESKLRKEELLLTQLTLIRNKPAGIKEKLLAIARAAQSYIPFDLIFSGNRPFSEGHFNDNGYLRIGFDEYQPIGEQELLNITGLTKDRLSAIIKNNPTETEAAIYDGMPESQNDIPPLQKVLFDCFKIESSLAFPVVQNNGTQINYFFYSRQRNIYTQHHINLLDRIRTTLPADHENQGFTRASTQAAPKATNIDQGNPMDLTGRSVFKNIIGSHPLLLAVLDLARQVAPYKTSVLILGESGTGKEKIAHSLHSLSPWSSGPFVKVNCAAIPATLMESELFGHEKGAFTGATEKRKGKFEQADGGTIFLDEIGELPLGMQVKLLRVLQEKEIEYVGGNSPKKVDVRIITATNRNLEKEVADGNFRLDLYYRLNVFPITLPTLRERKSDIEALALFFANKFCKEFNKVFTGLSQSMKEEMLAYNWPGNIRELENVLEQSVILSSENAKLELGRNLHSLTAESPVKPNIETLEEVKHAQRETERDCIIAILKKSNGRIRGANGAAELLKIKPTTLESKMARLDIKWEDFANSGRSI